MTCHPGEAPDVKTYCLALDLHNDPDLIATYRKYHETATIWPEVVESIKSHGILSETIYLIGNRMVMVLETTEEFSFEAKAVSDQANPKMREWESLMWRYQKALPQALPGEKWVRMEKIFEV
jgi:L-rhamnose mutarotase